MGKTNKPRKLSAYNKFVKKHRLAGKSMKQIGRMWKGKGSNPKSKPKSGGSSRSSSKTKGGRRVGSFNMNKIFGLVRKAALVAPALIIATGTATPKEKIRIGVKSYFAVDLATGRINLADLQRGWGPYVMSIVTTYGIPKLASIIRGL